MGRISEVYQRVRIVGNSNLDAGLKDKIIGDKVLLPVSATQRSIAELAVVALEDTDFLVKVNLIEEDGKQREIQRIPLGFALDLKISPRLFGFLGVKVTGGYSSAEKDAPEIEKAYEKIDSHNPPVPVSILNRIAGIGPYVHSLFP